MNEFAEFLASQFPLNEAMWENCKNVQKQTRPFLLIFYLDLSLRKRLPFLLIFSVSHIIVATDNYHTNWACNHENYDIPPQLLLDYQYIPIK